MYFVTVFFMDPKMFPSLTMMDGLSVSDFSVSHSVHISNIVLNKLGYSGSQCDQ